MGGTRTTPQKWASLPRCSTVWDNIRKVDKQKLQTRHAIEPQSRQYRTAQHPHPTRIPTRQSGRVEAYGSDLRRCTVRVLLCPHPCEVLSYTSRGHQQRPSADGSSNSSINRVQDFDCGRGASTQISDASENCTEG
eukprot:1816109-Pyramimonas_sp.AAC.1